MRGLLVMVLPEATSELFVLLLLFVMTAITYACLQYLDWGGTTPTWLGYCIELI